jgi:hypothetical protein
VNALQFRKIIERDGKLKACQMLDSSVSCDDEADVFIKLYVMKLLLASAQASLNEDYKRAVDMKVGAALVLWGNRLFDPRPSAVRKVWMHLEHYNKALIQGAGSLGKSYSAMVWFLLDYYLDPDFTTTKLISTSSGHAKSNTFSTLVRLHEESICPMPGEAINGYIGKDAKKRDAGIEVVAIPIGQDNKGALQGFHPKPRPHVHEIMGANGRVRAFLDECEEVPVGVWDGIANMLLSMDSKGTVKVAGAYNPKDISSKTAQNAEPVGGWDCFDIETGVRGQDEWLSRQGWQVLRLDAKKFENVKQRQQIYNGFVTYEGYRNLEAKNNGNSPEFYTFGRGCYPPTSAVSIIISSAHLTQQRGEYTFMGSTTSVAGFDTAVDGRDNAVLTRGRLGWAISFRRHVQQGDGTTKYEVIRYKKPRLVVQIDQQVCLRKGDTKIVGDGVIEACKAWCVSPEWLAMDRTGNGAAVHDYVRAIWSESVQGIDFNKAATEAVILDQDQEKASELYDGIVSEVWFAGSRWLEFGFLALAPGLNGDPLETELRSRRYVLGAGKTLRVEKKDDYKLRMGSQSPDFADSMLILLHGVRMRKGLTATMTETPRKKAPEKQMKNGVVDEVRWMDGPPIEPAGIY